MLKRLDDPDWPVRQQLAASLGVLPRAARDRRSSTLLERHGDDPITLDAALERPARQRSGGARTGCCSRTAQTPQREAAMTMIAATIVRGAQEAGVQQLLASIGDESRPAWQRAALLRGAEVALLGARDAGNAGAARRRCRAAAADAPCPTCPGGRAGPGRRVCVSAGRGGPHRRARSGPRRCG